MLNSLPVCVCINAPYLSSTGRGTGTANNGKSSFLGKNLMQPNNNNQSPSTNSVGNGYLSKSSASNSL